MWEGWPKTVDIVAMPAVIAGATTRSRKMTLAHEVRGSSLLPLPSQPRQRQQVHFFGSNQTMSTSTPPRQPRWVKRTASQWGGGGGGGRQIDVVITISCGSIQAADGNTEPPAYHHGLLPLAPFCAFNTFSLAIERRGLEKQSLLVVLSSYVHFHVSVLHLIFIDFVLES
jgi:hypothetical protein